MDGIRRIAGVADGHPGDVDHGQGRSDERNTGQNGQSEGLNRAVVFHILKNMFGDATKNTRTRRAFFEESHSQFLADGREIGRLGREGKQASLAFVALANRSPHEEWWWRRRLACYAGESRLNSDSSPSPRPGMSHTVRLTRGLESCLSWPTGFQPVVSLADRRDALSALTGWKPVLQSTSAIRAVLGVSLDHG